MSIARVLALAMAVQLSLWSVAVVEHASHAVESHQDSGCATCAASAHPAVDVVDDRPAERVPGATVEVPPVAAPEVAPERTLSDARGPPANDA
jgi:hypothetical protein